MKSGRRAWGVLICVWAMILPGSWPESPAASQGESAPQAPERRPVERSRMRPLRWEAGLAVSAVEARVIAGKRIDSSTRLKVEWRPLTGILIDHYEVEATESIGSTKVYVSTANSPVTLTGLKSGTSYTVRVKGCHDTACRIAATSSTASGATAEEHWQIQGSGTSYQTATRVIADGNIGAHVFRYGSWGGSELNGRLRLYYNPINGAEKGAKPALTASAATTSLGSVNQFSATSGYGLLNPCPPGPPGQPAPSCPGTGLVKSFLLFEAVPMAANIRFFFEATGTDSKTRILYLESQDGHLGRDFNRGSRTICQTIADYGPGGECEPRVAIGVEGDAVEGNPGIQHARQFKLVYPTRDAELEGRWDGAAGTAMVLTVNTSNLACSGYSFTQAYAIWDGSRWQIQYQSNGCPKLFEQMQAPNPVHLGGTRYKLYFNNMTGRRGQPSNPLTDLKVMKMIYADGSQTGSAGTVDFEDWETVSNARNIVYLWPDGSMLDDENESKFDDHVTIMPTRDPGYQVIYSNMSNAQVTPFIGMAVLVNP